MQNSTAQEHLLVTINLSGQVAGGSEAYEIKSIIEDQIHDFKIGSVLGSGTMTDGSAIDIEVGVKNSDKAITQLLELFDEYGIRDNVNIEIIDAPPPNLVNNRQLKWTDYIDLESQLFWLGLFIVIFVVAVVISRLTD